MADDNTIDYVDNFYINNWKHILWNGTDTPLFKIFSLSAKHPKITSYLGIGKSNDVIEFERHVADNVISWDTKTSDEYDALWNFPENMERARKIDRNVEGNNKIFKRLRRFSNDFKETESYRLFTPRKNVTDIHVDEVTTTVGKMLGVKFTKVFYIWEWMYGVSKYHIYDGETFQSTLYLKLDDTIAPRTIPLIPLCDRSQAVNYVESPNGILLSHELTHAVQYSFIPFYNVPKSVVEISSMFVENLFRKWYNCAYSDKFIRKQIGLAMADLKSNTPDEFNSNFEKYARVKNAGHIASRFWHYSNYPGVYYSYLLRRMAVC